MILKQVINNPPIHSTAINNYVTIHSTVVNSYDSIQVSRADNTSNDSSETDNRKPQPAHYIQTRSKGPVAEFPNVQTGVLERLRRKST